MRSCSMRSCYAWATSQCSTTTTRWAITEFILHVWATSQCSTMFTWWVITVYATCVSYFTVLNHHNQVSQSYFAMLNHDYWLSHKIVILCLWPIWKCSTKWVVIQVIALVLSQCQVGDNHDDSEALTLITSVLPIQPVWITKSTSLLI